ncbi:hypothetical protein HPB51_012860 [Rhipicephalus microplus]|uniref:Uncharacterized protein n=1 Tax=Rhipicephalus microplus TaxID=6941 RepID=A0A9J6EHD9_RHIMP|nr:hypothetical protein HPB51_012860 [Rhipicephalus microplus]
MVWRARASALRHFAQATGTPGAADRIRTPHRQDVIASFWYFNGTACTKWTFPHGRCPARQPGIYRTLGECSLQCVENGGQADSLRCGVPAPGECELEHLRYPYFADMQAEGSARCVNSSHATLLGRRCLIGINQFDSIKACQWACQG